MQFGGKMNIGNLGQEQTTQMVQLALDRGINFIDTADVYSLGESETLVGNAFAARKPKQLEDNIGAVDLGLSAEDVRLPDEVSDPGVPYPKWMVLQLDTAEDPRPKVLHPEKYGEDGRWKDLRGSRWSG
jgi:aryl-alcohol dehydrogenase-like predicted oxidoreductase